MRRIYLIRHAQVNLSQINRRCISKTDIPLDKMGILQAERLREWARGIPLEAVFSSSLSRCVRTAEIMTEGRIPLHIHDGLREMSVGKWENMSFDEIRSKYPIEYKLRGEHLGTIAPPGGESFLEAGLRLIYFMNNRLSDTRGDIAIVAHAGINRGALCHLTGYNPDNIMGVYQPYGGINTLIADENRKLSAASIGVKPDSVPPDFELEILFEKHKTPPDIREHCRAVAEAALLLAKQVTDEPVNEELLLAACELHDLVRGSKNCGSSHAERGADILASEGYPYVAEIVAGHHDLPANAGIETQLLYLTDKIVLGTKRVTIDERFAVSAKKSLTGEARKAWRRRMEDARAVIRRFNLDLELIICC